MYSTRYSPVPVGLSTNPPPPPPAPDDSRLAGAVTVQLALLEGQLVTSTAPVPSPMVSGSHQSAPSDAELSGLIGRCVMKERKINAAASFELSLRLSRVCLGTPSYCSSGGNRRGKRHRLSSYLRDRQPATAAAAACRDSQDGVASAVGPRPTHPGGQASTPLTTSCCAVTRRAQRAPEILLQRERERERETKHNNGFCQRFRVLVPSPVVATDRVCF